MHPSRILLPLAVVAALLVAPSPAQAERPTLTVTVVADGLQHPWDLGFVPNATRTMLFTQRDRKTVTLMRADGSRTTVLSSPPGMWSGGESGLMGLQVAADWNRTRDFITCHAYRKDGVRDVRAVRWHLSTSYKTSLVKTLVPGLPSTSGRHGGCALEALPGNLLAVGTGDAAVSTNPRSLTSGRGKVLRLGASLGSAPADNPWADADQRITRVIWTRGHRNVQGLALRADGSLWSVEHGSSRDDEVNRLVKGGDYGWNPVPGYDESVPMTDQSLPGTQQDATWSSGDPTVATSGAAWVKGSRWDDLEGTLAVTALKDQSVRFMRFSSGGTLEDVFVYRPGQGRLRAAVMGPDGSLYVTTSNGSNDKILRITPS